jgi:hypothetical protein
LADAHRADDVGPRTRADQDPLLARQASSHLEGLLVGAMRVGQRPEFHGTRIVTMLCDSGERYLSTPLFQPADDIG